ncbi:MAG: SDR family oxidoreductase [Chlamydiales bacterium]|nr:SDR family oxidoreductase [Chlamydiales bacterium]
MDLKLQGKKVLVQGSSSGLGFAIAQAFANEGAQVAICSRDKERVMKAAKEIPGATGFVCDLDQKGAAAALVKDVAAKFGGIDILVTNSGGPPKGLFTNLSAADWQQGFERLYLSAIESISAALPFMREQKWGRVLMSTSTAAKEPIAKLTVSNSLRSGLLGLMKSLSQEVAVEGITVNALLPGYTRTERLAELGAAEKDLIKEIPAKRLGEPEEYAALAIFLASHQAAYITGQAIACDGGLIKGL